MIYKKKPLNFNSKFNVVGCFIEYNKEILLLLRQDYKPEGNTWCIPGGKINIGENNLNAIVREIYEETNIQLNDNKLNYFKKIFVKYPNYDFIYYIYHTKLNKRIKITINYNEHKDFKWYSLKEALNNNNLIQDLDSCIKLFYNI